jgi:hypothetical protein
MEVVLEYFEARLNSAGVIGSKGWGTIMAAFD